MCQMSLNMCQMKCVMSHFAYVTRHMSLTPTATAKYSSPAAADAYYFTMRNTEKKKKKHRKIAKRCPANISLVADLSTCSYQKTVLSFVRTLNARILAFEFVTMFCVLVSSQFMFFYYSFVAI